MSQLRVVDQGELAFLDLITAVNYTLRLFTNDVEAGLTAGQMEALTEADFDEATFAGYSAAALTGGSWTTVDTDPSFATYAEQSFVRSSTGTAQLIWGYYLETTTGGFLRYYEQFDGPVSIEFEDDELAVTPLLTLDDEGGAVDTGDIKMTGSASTPAGWLLCNGQAVSRTTFAALFAAIGTAYGVGNGTTTFNVPDLRQRFPMGQAASGTGATLGASGGTIDHVHGLDTATSHARVSFLTSSPHGRMQRKTVTTWAETVEIVATSGAANTTTTTLGAALGGNSDTANPPFQTVRFLIKT